METCLIHDIINENSANAFGQNLLKQTQIMLTMQVLLKQNSDYAYDASFAEAKL
jgi:hypothetical protein